MIKMSYLLCLLTMAPFYLYGGNLIVLHGSSRSGKTSVQKALLASDSSWSFIDQDELWGKGVAQKIKEHFSNEYQIIVDAISIENFFHAVERNLIVFKPDISNELRDNACAALIKVAAEWHDPIKVLRKNFIRDLSASIIQEIVSRVKAGENIIADLPFYHDLQEHLAQLNCKIYTVLLYCPFSVVVERFEKRNNIAIEARDLREHRVYANILPHYLQVYQACADQGDAIGYFEYRELKDCFACIRNSAHSLYEMYALAMPNFVREFNQNQLADVEKEYLQQFNVHEEGRAYIKPKLTYDMIVDTTQMSPQDIARLILERFAEAVISR